VKVLHVVAAGEIGGAERLVADLASRPGASGAEHAIALLTPSAALAATFTSAGIRVHDRGRVREDPAAYLWRSLGPRDVAWIAGVGRDERASIVHLHTFASQVVGTRAAERLGARVVRTEHSTRVYDDPSCWPFSRWSLRRCDAAVAISRHVRDVAIAKAPWAAPKVRVVLNGVDVERFALAEPRAIDGPLVLALVGRLDPRKGVDAAIEAIARCAAEGVDARLDVVGDGAERARLDALVRARGVADRVTLHGRMADPRPIVAAAHAALSSSRKEGLGIANLEAMAMGRPVIALPTGGVPEVVIDGENGLLAAGSDATALAARIRDAARDRARLAAMGAAARDFVVARASISAMCRAYGEVYRAVAAPQRP